MMMSTEQMRRIREYELGTIMSILPKGCSILEIGAGTEVQAKLLSEKRYSVIDTKISIRCRMILSYLFGSSGHIYIETV